MCGRSSLGVGRNTLRKRYSVDKDNSSFEKSYNIAPVQKQAVIRQGSILMEDMHWGFIPSWGDKEEWKSKSVINARAETASESNLFKEAVKEKRCLIPSTGFYEWKGSRGSKTPFHITWKNNQVMSFAGIFSEYEDGRYSYAVLTQEPNDAMAEIHDRMPVILTNQEEKNWLEENIAPEIIDQIASEELEIYPVSRKVNNPAFDSKKCIQRKEGLSDF